MTVVILLLCVGLIAYSLLSRRKQKADREKAYSSLGPGDRITTIGGMRGTVSEKRDDTLIVDFSPDGSGSLVEIEKEGFFKALDD